VLAVHAELRSLLAPDAPGGDPSAFTPDDPFDFGLLVQALIGPAGEPGEESFDFTVCTASWLARQDLPKGFEFQRGKLVLNHWDPGLMVRAISDLCLRTQGADWRAVAEKLSRYARWEFEDYNDGRVRS
jgi:Immunity protein 8